MHDKLDAIEKSGSEWMMLSGYQKAKLTCVVTPGFWYIEDEPAKEEKKEAPSITVDALTHALLKTHGRYDSKQDQAAAIMKILEEQCKKPSDTK